MTIFNTEYQEFDKKIVPILVEKNDKLFLSPELWNLLWLIWDDALKILDWVEVDWIKRSYRYWENIDISKEDELVTEFSKNIYPFVIENNKIILDKLEK